MRWAGHVFYVGRRDVHTGFWWENLMERDHLEDLGIAERIILESILKKKKVGRTWTGLIWLRTGTNVLLF